MKMLVARTVAGAVLIFVAAFALSTYGFIGTPQVALETRTFRFEHLQPGQVHGLLEAYVWEEREAGGGSMSLMDGGVTIRETRDNLDRIEEVLSEFDRPQDDVQLFFQIIEANGSAETDVRIAGVESELRKLFAFEGYRLAAESAVTATDGSSISQGMRTDHSHYEVSADVRRLGDDQLRLSGVHFVSADGWALTTSVNVGPGQTIVLGSSPKGDSDATLFLTVRAERVDSAQSSQQ